MDSIQGVVHKQSCRVGHRGYWTVVKEWVVNGRRRTCRVVESIWQTETKAVFKKRKRSISYDKDHIYFPEKKKNEKKNSQ